MNNVEKLSKKIASRSEAARIIVENMDKLGTMSDKEFSEEYCVSRSPVSAIRRDLGIDKYDGPVRVFGWRKPEAVFLNDLFKTAGWL